MVCTNACSEGIGGVLMREVRVICFESKKLKEHEKNYVIHDLELPTIIHALKVWRHYLMGKKFELRIDHLILKYLWDQSHLNARQARRLKFLSECDFKIKYVKEKENEFSDALNRKMHLAIISEFKIDLRKRDLKGLKKDDYYLQVLK